MSTTITRSPIVLEPASQEFVEATSSSARSGQHLVKGADRTRRYQTELLIQLQDRLSCKDAGQCAVAVFLDTEEVRGSNPLAPTSKSPGEAAISLVSTHRPDQLGPPELLAYLDGSPKSMTKISGIAHRSDIP